MAPPKTHPEPGPETKVVTASGIDVDDLTDDLMFSDAGIDSLMGLTISARFKEEMDFDVDFDALFYEYPTVKSLKELLGDSGVSTIPIEDAFNTPSSSTSGSTTPSLPNSNISRATTPDPGNSISFQRALAIVSEESGVAIGDFTDDTSFADCGVDSLLSMVIVSRFRDELEIDIPNESLFLECPTVLDLRRLIEEDTTESKDMSPAPLAERKPEPTPAPAPAPAPKPEEAPIRSETEMASLTTRMKAVKQYVQKYTACFS